MGCLLFHLLTWPLQGPFYVHLWMSSALPFTLSSAIMGIIFHWLALSILGGKGTGETLHDVMLVCGFTSVYFMKGLFGCWVLPLSVHAHCCLLRHLTGCHQELSLWVMPFLWVQSWSPFV